MTVQVLIVDDEESIQFALKRYFQGVGYSVKTATTLDEAEALVEVSTFDVMLVDLVLGAGTEGLEFVRLARRLNPSALIVMLSAHGDRALKAEAFRRGVDAFVDKPTELAELARIVADLTRVAAERTNEFEVAEGPARSS